MALRIEQHFVGKESFAQAQWKAEPTPPPMEYSIVPLTPVDGQRTLDFLRRFFFRDEPLNIDVQLLGETGEGGCTELDEFCLESISEPYSLMAVSASGDLVGVCLNGTHEPGHLADIEAKANSCPNLKFRKILKLLAAVERRADIFGQFPDVKSLMEVRVISVDGAWRGRGIATALLDKTRDLAINNGFKMIRADCTSLFSARAMARLGSHCIFEMPYTKYLDEEKKPVFTPNYPHDTVSTYVLRLP